MKKIIAFLTICLLTPPPMGVILADDVSVTETFGDIRETAVASNTYDLHFCSWQTNDVRKKGENETEGEDYIYTKNDNKKAHTDCLWLRRLNASNPGSSVRTTNLTGGIKAISILMAKFANEADCAFKLKVDVGTNSTTVDISNYHRDAGGYPWKNNSANIKNDAQIVISNVSTGGNQARRIVVGTVTLTPYLMYTQKVANIDLNGGAYTHPIIDNTAGESGTLTFASSDPNKATVTNEGVVTPVGVGSTTITATYTWDETHSVTASYTLYVTRSIKETFSGVEQATMTEAEGSPWSSDYFFEWQAKLARRSTDDKIGDAQCSWLATGANQASLTTTNLEGGIKSIYFPYAQFGGEALNYLKIQVRTLDEEGNTISYEEKTRGKGSNCGNNKATGLSFYWESNCAQNAQLQIINTSVNRANNGNPTSNARWLVGDVVITPYLLYTNKVVSISRNQTGYSNSSLINNTTSGTISYSSSNEGVATVDNGVVTPVSPGVTTITATWGNVSTSYKLYVDDVITEDFSKAPTAGVCTTRVSYLGNYSEWYYRNGRSKKSDKLVSEERGFWLSPEASDNNTYLETTTEGGIKKVDFKWREFDKAYQNGYKFNMKVLTDDDAQIDQISFIGADSYADNDQPYSKVTSIRRNNAKFKILNLSTQSNGTTKGGKLIIGPITITPYLLYTRKSVSVSLSDGTYTHPIINNTISEVGSLTYTSSNPSVASVDGDGEVTLNSGGTTIITATFTWEDSESVSTSYALSVVENVSLIEDFSKIPDGLITVDATQGRSYAGNYSTWWHRNASYGGENYTLNDGTKGFWLNHVIKPKNSDTEYKSAYIETGRSGDFQEGGIKNVSFKWHQFGNGSNQTIKLQIKVTDVVKETIEKTGGDANCTLATTDQEYNSNADVYSKSNAKLTIANVSYKTGEPSTDDQGRVIIGPITITPYLFYLDREVTITKNKRYVHPLLDNTDNEGTITYSFVSPSVEGMATINARTGEVIATKEGNVTVKATWSEGAYTTYTLHVQQALTIKDNVDNSLILTAYNGETADVNTNRSLVADAWNTLCMPFEINVSDLGEGADVQDLFGVEQDGEELIFGFKPITEDVLEAGHPYLVKPTSNVTLTNFTGKTIVAEPMTLTKGAYALQGVFKPTTLINDGKTLFVGPETENGNLYYPSASGNLMNGMRAYFKKVSGPAAAPKRIRYVVNYHNTATDVESIQDLEVSSQKILRDGHLFIIREGKVYDAQGMLVK